MVPPQAIPRKAGIGRATTKKKKEKEETRKEMKKDLKNK